MVFSAPADLHGGMLTVAIFIAEWTIYFGPAVLVLLWLFGDHIERKAAVSAGLAGALSLLLATLTSACINSPRPFVASGLSNHLHHTADSSLPSDHAALLSALAFSLLLHKPTLNLGVALAITAVVMGAARVYLNVHYPVDIFVASLIGFLTALVFTRGFGLRLSLLLTSLGEWLFGFLSVADTRRL